MSWLSDALNRAIPRQTKKDIESVVKTATIGNQLLETIDVSQLPDAVQLYIRLHDSEDDYLLALNKATKQNIGDVLVSELLTGHINVAEDERRDVLDIRDEVEAFLKK